MKTNFKDFLFEMYEIPDVVKPYRELLYSKIENLINRYLSSKGQFRNKIESYEFKWEDIKPVIKEKDFVKYPVEEISFKYGVRIGKYYKTTRLRYSGGYTPLREPDSTTYEIESKSGLVQNALHLDIEVFVEIPKMASGVVVDEMYDLAKLTLEHELLHSFQDTKIPMKVTPQISAAIKIQDLFISSNKKDKNQLSKLNNKHVFYLFYMLYLDKAEMDANIAAINRNNFQQFYKQDFKYMKELVEDIDKYYKICLEEMRIENLTNIVNKYVDLYTHDCVGNPSPKILSCEDNPRLFVEFVYNYIKPHYIYFKRKVDKKLGRI